MGADMSVPGCTSSIQVQHSCWCLQAEYAANPDFVYSERITWAQSIAVLKVRTNLFVFIQGLPGCFPWGVLLTYLTDYLAQNKGMTVQRATVVRSCCHFPSVKNSACRHSYVVRAIINVPLSGAGAAGKVMI